jgi:hypothetical protein
VFAVRVVARVEGVELADLAQHGELVGRPESGDGGGQQYLTAKDHAAAKAVVQPADFSVLV